MTLRNFVLMGLAVGMIGGRVGSVPGTDTSTAWPPLAELHSLLRTRLPDVPPPSPSQTNPVAYLESLAPEVLIGEVDRVTGPTLSKTNIYDSGVGYIRIANVEPGLSAELATTLQSFSGYNPLLGIILDLRYAGGQDFGAAAAAAGLFAVDRHEELRLGDRALEITPGASRPPPPLMVLMNHATRGAAEALAAAVRSIAAPCLLLGTNSAGQARVYQDLQVPGGEILRVASAALSLPDAGPVPASGLAPDLTVEVSPADEALYFADEFHRVFEGRRLTNSATVRLNEAELVRRRRGLRPQPVGPMETEPTVEDPVLARGIDLLSGFAAAQAGDGGNSR